MILNEIKEILDKLSNRKQETLLQGLRECQLKNIQHVFITREEYIDKVLNYIKEIEKENARLKDKIDKAVEYIKNIDKYEETLNDDTRVYMIQDVDVDEIERILKEN